MLKNLENKRVILGSKSPRRKELLDLLGIDFKIKHIDADESYPTNLKENEITEYISLQKASIFDLKNDEVLITADTLVLSPFGRILEKPKNLDQAKEMLLELSGNEHVVYSSFCVKSLEKKIIQSDQTIVKFNKLNEYEIDYYIQNFNPLDKSGSYGIQEWIGAIGIEKINGSFFTVMGLPTHLLYRVLMNF